eukprot:9458510-Alexandrium_andersonii.AAC.1
MGHFPGRTACTRPFGEPAEVQALLAASCPLGGRLLFGLVGAARVGGSVLGCLLYTSDAADDM